MKKSIKIFLSFSLVFIVATTTVFADDGKLDEIISDEMIVDVPVAEDSEIAFEETESPGVPEETEAKEIIEESETTDNNPVVQENEEEIINDIEVVLSEDMLDSIMSSGINGNTTWELNSNGLLTISPKPNTDGKIMSPFGSPLDKGLVKTIEVNEGVQLPNNAVSTFSKYPVLEKINFKNINTSNVTSMADLFSDNPKLSDLNIGNWDVSNVTNMSRMFKNAKSLKSLDLSEWVTENAKHLSEMFIRASSLTELDISTWNVGNVTTTRKMFEDAESLESLDLSHWDVSSLEDMSEMFSNAHSLKHMDLNDWETIAATNMSYMFTNAKSLESLSISNWDVSSVTNMSSMFSGLESLEELDVSNWNVSNVKNMRHLFSKSTALKKLDINAWKPVSVTNTSNMFENMDSIQTLDLSHWKLTNLANMTHMFASMSSLESLNVDNWEFLNQVTMTRAFSELSSLKTLDLSTWNVPKGSTNMYIFAETPLDSISLSSSFKFDRYQDFPEIVSDNNYSGKWVKTEEPHSAFESSKSFLEDYDSGDAGTYVRQKIFSVNYVLDEKASHNNKLTYNQYEGIPELHPAYMNDATFIGWLDENLELIHSIPKDLNRDITLTAKFLESEFSITYVLDGGINHEENPVSYKVGIGVKEFKEATKFGYDFIGWYDENDNVITNISTTDNGDITLYAKYKAKEFQLSYDLDGGINNDKNPTSYTYGEGVDVFFDPTKDNHQFIGWIDADGTAIKSISDTDSGDCVLKAVWKENKVDDNDQIESEEKTPPTGLEDFTHFNILIVLFSLLVLLVVRKSKALNK